MTNRIYAIFLFLLASLSGVYGNNPYSGASFETSAKAVQETNHLQNEVILHEFGIDHMCHHEDWVHRMTKIQDANFEACKKIRKQVDQSTANKPNPWSKEGNEVNTD